MPIDTLLFSALLQSMIDYGISLTTGKPNGEAFLAVVQHFAIYNAIVGVAQIVFSYLATILMNISAYNQVSLRSKLFVYY